MNLNYDEQNIRKNITNFSASYKSFFENLPFGKNWVSMDDQIEDESENS